MIPIIFEEGTTDYTTNGLGRLSDTITCKVTEERNGSYELEMTYPMTGIHYDAIKPGATVKAVPADGVEADLFDIYKVTRPLGGIVTVYAEHVSYRLSRITVMPFTADSCVTAMQGLKANSVGVNNFTFSTDKSISTTYTQTTPATVRSRLAGVEGSILDLYRGEYRFHQFSVELLTNRGADKGVSIRYGKNLMSLTQEENIQNTITGIVPYWQSWEEEQTDVMTLSHPAVYADNADAFANQRTIPVDFSYEFEEQPTEEQLKARAQKYLKDNDAGIPEVSLTVSFVNLWQTPEYASVASLQRVSLCDTVTVSFPELRVKTKAEVTKTVYDVLADRYDSVELGSISNASLAESIVTGQYEAKEEAVKEAMSGYSRDIAAAADLLAGGLGGHVVIRRNADGQPNEILCMDTTDPETAVNVIRINQAGIGFSTAGYAGPYNTALTIDGTIDARNVNVVNMDATNITSGRIASRDGTSWWNLETGELVLAASSATVGGAEVETSDTIKDMRDQVTTLAQHLKWDPARGLSIMVDNDDGSDLEMLLTAEKLSFLVNGHETAYFRNRKLYVTDAQILSSIQIGGFAFVPRSNGNMAFTWVGDATASEEV